MTHYEKRLPHFRFSVLFDIIYPFDIIHSVMEFMNVKCSAWWLRVYRVYNAANRCCMADSDEISKWHFVFGWLWQACCVSVSVCVCVCKRGTCGTAHCTLHSDLCQSKKRQQTNVRCTLWWRGHTTHCTAQADIITNFFKCVYVLFAFREQPIFTSNKRWMHLGYHLYSFGNNGQKVNTKKNY